MIGRIVEIADDKRHLQVDRGFMMIRSTGSSAQHLGQVPLDDICAVIANAHGLSYTNNLLVALAERGAPFVLCGANHNVVGMLWPIEGNYHQSKRIENQISAGKPIHKRLWAEIVKAKLLQQAAALDAIDVTSAPLRHLAKNVRSGDPENTEAQGARKYWSLLLGDEFRRDQSAGGLNSLLNYGYTVLRAATARAVVAAGLHPSIGIHHSNDSNAMRLVDDLMEPFRPIIDLKVWQLTKKGNVEITPDTKRALVHTLYDDLRTDSGNTPVMVCLQRLCTSLAQVYTNERRNLDMPFCGLPLDLRKAVVGIT
jgi:CRISP-associated protein Cas1